jgi:CHAT domain-containing protein/Tfp pilus assembly protein PilF
LLLGLILAFVNSPSVPRAVQPSAPGVESARVLDNQAADTLNDALEKRLQSWEQLVGESKGSKEALKEVRQYVSHMSEENLPNPHPLIRAQGYAHRDGDRLGEALVSILLSREYLVLSGELKSEAPVEQAVAGRQEKSIVPGKERESFSGDRVDTWQLIPQSLLPRAVNSYQRGMLKLAKENLERAISLLTGPEDETLVAFIHQALGEYWYEGRGRQALVHAGKALEFFTKHHQAVEMARTQATIGEAYALLGDYEQALNHLMMSLQIEVPEPSHSRTEIGVSAISGCALFQAGGNLAEYEKCLLRDLEDSKDSGDETFILTLLGNHYHATGAYEKALERYEAARRIYQSSGADYGTAGVLSSMADVYSSMGQLADALKLHRQAAEMYRKHGEIYNTAHEWATAGSLAVSIGQYRTGLVDLAKALSVFVRVRLQSDVTDDLVLILPTIGDALERLGKYEQALKVYERRSAIGPGPRALIDMSRVEFRLDEKMRAVQHIDEAARLVGRVGENSKHTLELTPAFLPDYVPTLIELGIAEIDIGRRAEGIKHLQEALSLATHSIKMTIGTYVVDGTQLDTKRIATIHFHLGRGLMMTHNFREALPHILNSIRILEKFQGHAFSVGREKGAEYLGGELEQAYRFAIALYLNLGEPDSAFSVLAQSKMRVLQAIIRRHELSFKTERGRGLWKERAQLLSKLSDLTTSMLSGRATDGEQLGQEVERLEDRRARVERGLNEESVPFSDIFETPAITHKHVQAILDDHTAVVEYAVLGDVVGFVIQKQGFSVIHANGQQVDASVREFLKAQKWSRGGRSGEGYEESARRLYRLLFEPLKQHLSPSIRNLVIVSDGVLHLFPFEAAIDPEGRFLLQTYTIDYVNSVKELLTQKRTVGRGLLAYGGALHSERAARLERHAREGATPAVARGPSRECAGLSPVWEDLKGTDQEARMIAALMGGVARVGLKATESDFKRDAPGKQYIVISSHGYFSDCQPPPSTSADELLTAADPLLRSGLVFSGANTGGDGHEDGYLTALEVLGVNLTGVNLVVLSACDTGVGDLHAGEGVLGLKRSFLAAGARSLVISLWKVPNVETRDLMVAFFKQIKRGESKAEALRKAKLEIIRQGKTRPYYWAAFVLVGR